jgi:hypothetical protein
MARAGKMAALKVAALARAKAPGHYGDGGGLFLQISRFGTASWVFRYRVAGRLREMGLGSLDTIGLADARERAHKAREHRLDGRDPIELRKSARLAARLDAAKAVSFRDCAKRYIAAHQPSWRNPKHAKQWGATLETCVYPVFGDLAVQVVDVGLVLKAIEPIWTVKPETASRVRGRIESILDWATARLPRGREPGPLARPSGKPAAGARQGAPGRASRSAALYRDERLHGGASGAGRSVGADARIRDPDRCPHRRGHRRPLGGDQHR